MKYWYSISHSPGPWGRWPRRLLATFLLVLLYSSMLPAQRSGVSSGTSERIWLSGGGGLSSSGRALGGSGTYDIDSNLISLRFIYNARTNEFPKPSETVWDIGLMYGREFTMTSSVCFSVSGGVAIVGGTRARTNDTVPNPTSSPSYTQELFGGIGFPVEATILTLPTEVAGLSLTGFANINDYQSFAGILVNLRLGRMR